MSETTVISSLGRVYLKQSLSFAQGGASYVARRAIATETIPALGMTPIQKSVVADVVIITDTKPETFVSALSKVPAKKRFGLIMRRDPIGAGSIVAGLIGSVYALAHAVASFLPLFIGYLAPTALAAGGNTSQSNHPIINGIVSGRDPFDWMISGVMAIVLIMSVIATFVVQNEKKISTSSDLTKLIAGALLGFVSGGKSAP